MRWLFLLLVVLNVFYYVWHQQEAPVRVKEVVSLSLYKGSQQDIRLLSEARPLTPAGVVPVDHLEGVECTYLGNISSEDQLRRIQRRLADMDIQAQRAYVNTGDLVGYAIQIDPESSSRINEMLLQDLANEFNELKHKKMQCEGLQVPGSLHRMAPAPQ